MAELLPTVGTKSYNGFTFPAKTLTTQFSADPVLDRARRTVVYTVYRIALKTLIYFPGGADTTDAQMDTVRNTLIKQGGAFRYSDAGVGTFAINVSGVRDVMWGPIPKILSWRPKGSAQAADVEWAVEVAIPQCAEATYMGQLMAWNYRVRFEIDKSGLSKRTYSGYIQIPQTRNGQTNPLSPDTADDYLELIFPSVPNLFRREMQTREIDESKSMMEFSFTDTQLPVPLQADVVECQAEHTIQSNNRGFATWTGTVSATYEMTNRVQRMQSWNRFLALLTDRFSYVANGIQRVDVPQPAVDARIIPLSFTFKEAEIFGKAISYFSCSYTLLTNLATLLSASGLWRPVATANDPLWRISMDTTAHHVRGDARLGMVKDAIVDLCINQAQPDLPGGSNTVPPPFVEGLSILVAQPTPEQSWMVYDSRLKLDMPDRTIEHKPLTPTLTPVVPGGSLATIINTPQFAGAATFFSLNQGSQSFYSSGTSTGFVQSQAVPSIEVILEGQALRAGYLIPEPTLKLVNGVDVVPANREGQEFFNAGVVANVGIPIAAATWRRRYLLRNIPSGSLGMPFNPMYR